MLVFVETTVVKHIPTDIMGNTVLTNATVTIHKSVIMCADTYKRQLQRIASPPTTQKQYLRILSKLVFLLLTPALIIQVCILYDDDDDDDDDDGKKNYCYKCHILFKLSVFWGQYWTLYLLAKFSYAPHLFLKSFNTSEIIILNWTLK